MAVTSPHGMKKERAMLCVAICHDVEGAAQRSALFQAHVAHNLKHMGAFVLTGPVATADGSSGVGDDPRLCGSVYCLDAVNLVAARAIMEADPFMQGAWRQVDYYEWRDPRGAWTNEAARPKGLSPDFRCYFAASESEPAGADALMSGALGLVASTGTPQRTFTALTVLHADTIEAARAQAPDGAWVVNVPIAIGRWVRIASPADLPTAPS
jgi:uncharacterized protein YciI